MKSFEPFLLRGLELKNRIVMPPMCMYSADDSGIANAFHQLHYETRALGGVGLIIMEATGVIPNGRISENDLGLWNDEQRDALKVIVDKVHKYGAKIGIQLAHAGRKHVGLSDYPVAPSAIAFDEQSRIPHELTVEEIKELVDCFVQAAIRADEAGFDTVEIHSAHGYLIHEFLSPVTNHRSDEYGGSFANRLTFLKEIIEGVRKVFPTNKPLLLRVSATDYIENGLTCNDVIAIINEVKSDLDMVHVSSGGLQNVPMNVFPGYQLNLSQQIKEACQIPTIAVGVITQLEMIEEILSNNRADLVALGRELLRNPYFVLNSARKNQIKLDYPTQYIRGFM